MNKIAYRKHDSQLPVVYENSIQLPVSTWKKNAHLYHRNKGEVEKWQMSVSVR